MTRTRKTLTGIAAVVLLASFGTGGCRRGAAQEPVFYTGHGGQQTVSGSLHALEVAEQFYLVDTGAFVCQEGLNHPWPWTPSQLRVTTPYGTLTYPGRITIVSREFR